MTVNIQDIFSTFLWHIKVRLPLIRCFDDFGFSERNMSYILLVSFLEHAPKEYLYLFDIEHDIPKKIIDGKTHKKLDLWIACERGGTNIAIECKYHSEHKSRDLKIQMGQPHNAGRIYEDFRRLSEIKRKSNSKVDCYFVYIASKTMAKYLCDRKHKFFNLGKNEELEITKKFLSSKCKIEPKSFNQIAEPFNCKVKNVLNEVCGDEEFEHYIKIFEVTV